MVVATRRGDAVELPRTAWDEWSAVREEFRRQGRRGSKRMAMLALRLGLGFSCGEIAEAVGLSEGHVRREISRARRMVQKKVIATKNRARKLDN